MKHNLFINCFLNQGPVFWLQLKVGVPIIKEELPHILATIFSFFQGNILFHEPILLSKNM